MRLAVLGAGPGGYPAAFHAAERGLDVTLIDTRPQPGGVCLYEGCIPSKALLHVAKLIREARHASEWGISFGEPQIDLDQLRDWKDGVVRKMTNGLGLLRRQHHVRYQQGFGRIRDANQLNIESNGEVLPFDFDALIIATGSSAAIPRPLQLDSERVMDAAQALELPDVPDSLLVVGGGYIGLELGTVYAELGSTVTVVESLPDILSGVEHDLVRVLKRSLRSRFAETLVNTTVVSLTEVDQGIEAVLADDAGVERTETFDRVLIATGRRPNSAGLGLHRTRAHVDDHGFIVTDMQRRTAEPSIFAIGDVAGEPMLAHKATAEASVAVEAILGEPAVFRPLAVPAVIFTDPEIAWCGLSQADASAIDVEATTVSFPWAALGRASASGRNDGLTRLVIEQGSERVLGMQIVGPGAGELIGEGVLAVEMGARASDLAESIHAHPTLNESIMEAAQLFFGRSPHYVARRR
ncbi:MAG: dihydrolipoyl dehydrogenase [Chloroflexi bacterium]|nr:dihydrolipoyl dehydrogenase [Chloroflexota bacterium]MYD17623.1 dihydrolipoyl dehydrogenase [Chloroflexota bacterium]